MIVTTSDSPFRKVCYQIYFEQKISMRLSLRFHRLAQFELLIWSFRNSSSSSRRAFSSRNSLSLDNPALPFAQEHGRLDLIKSTPKATIFRCCALALDFYEYKRRCLLRMVSVRYNRSRGRYLLRLRSDTMVTSSSLHKFRRLLFYRFDPDLLFLRSLVSITVTQSVTYFDVFSPTCFSVAWLINT